VRVPFELVDGRGRRVTVTTKAWTHVSEAHPELSEQAVRLAVADPDMVIRPTSRPRRRHVDRRVNARLGAHDRYENLYVVTVVDYGADENRLVTAYLSPQPPKGELLFVRFPIRGS
jgi:hypothetical protein